ncbi:MAG TPA: SHOCT domain-containing protein [Opitutaceae bacterium]|nr:SHOCT domain-containing protein [Opitutaceae bacterium]
MKNKKPSSIYSYALMGAFLFVAGCQSSGIVQLSGDTYMVSKSSAAGAFANMSNLKASVIREANEFAASKGKLAVARGFEWQRPAQGFPSVDYQFILVDKDDPRAKDITLAPRANVVIEKNEKISADINPKNTTEKQPDLYAELTRLDDLKKKGIITEVEFQTLKQKLLARANP